VAVQGTTLLLLIVRPAAVVLRKAADGITWARKPTNFAVDEDPLALILPLPEKLHVVKFIQFRFSMNFRSTIWNF